FPETAQLRHALGWMVARDNGGVDSADGNAGDPVGVKVRFGERFIDPGLIGAQRATPLQQQSEALEGRPVGNSVRFAAPAKSSFSLGGSVHSPPPLIRSRSKMQPTSLSVLLITVTVGATSPRRRQVVRRPPPTIAARREKAARHRTIRLSARQIGIRHR